MIIRWSRPRRLQKNRAAASPRDGFAVAPAVGPNAATSAQGVVDEVTTSSPTRNGNFAPVPQARKWPRPLLGLWQEILGLLRDAARHLQSPPRYWQGCYGIVLG